MVKSTIQWFIVMVIVVFVFLSVMAKCQQSQSTSDPKLFVSPPTSPPAIDKNVELTRG